MRQPPVRYPNHRDRFPLAVQRKIRDRQNTSAGNPSFLAILKDLIDQRRRSVGGQHDQRHPPVIHCHFDRRPALDHPARADRGPHHGPDLITGASIKCFQYLHRFPATRRFPEHALQPFLLESSSKARHLRAKVNPSTRQFPEQISTEPAIGLPDQTHGCLGRKPLSAARTSSERAGPSTGFPGFRMRQCLDLLPLGSDRPIFFWDRVILGCGGELLGFGG